MERIISALGIFTLIGLCFLFSNNRKNIRWKTVFWGFGLQLIFAILILKTQLGKNIFLYVNNIIVAFLDFTRDGSGFVFGKLIDSYVPVGTKASAGGFESDPGLVANTGAFFAFTVLPTIIFFSTCMAVLYHLGIIQKVVQSVAWVMAKSMKTSGAESLSASANIFVGQTEAPLVIRPYVTQMTKSELMAIMTAGFATVAGGVMAAYVAMLREHIPTIAGHLMAASVMSAPAALALAKIMYPEMEQSETAGTVKTSYKKETRNVVDAAAQGASQGVKLAINVGAMLIAFLALVALINGILGWVGGFFGFETLSLSWVFGKLMWPLAFVMGVPLSECGAMGDLLGTKLMLTEFVAYAKLQAFAGEQIISERTVLIASYALCGFANVGSIGIQLGGIGGIAPNRKHDLASVGVRAMFAGAFASFSTACIAGILL